MIQGPAVADVEAAFAESWATTGSRVPPEELPAPEQIPPAGDVALRVIATMPSTWGVFKLDQLVASVARETLWVTDAYFVGVSAYINALIAASKDGVDVRLLVPGTVDVFGVGAMSRAGYRALLEGGVRIFEWNGVMIHAKTAVADGRWARVGSTNANITSWFGNWELDVAIEDANFGQQMMAMYQTGPRELHRGRADGAQDALGGAAEEAAARGLEESRPHHAPRRCRGRHPHGPHARRRADRAPRGRRGGSLQPVLELADLPRAWAWSPQVAQGDRDAVAVLAVWFALAGLFRAWRLTRRRTGQDSRWKH